MPYGRMEKYMKATGIVRRIDDLGRVVIPKEIRRTMRIKEGDPLEIFTDREGEVIFKKYSPIGEMQSFANDYADTLQKTSSSPIFICDRDAVIAVSGASKREYLERRISRGLEEIVETRSLYIRGNGREPVSIISDGGTHYVNCAMPILSEGDIVGCVVSAWQYDMSTNGKISDEIESKLVQTAGMFLGRQMEG
jgi:AbrB family transcriptional regulator (stage V sporulation protein T)